MKIKDIEIKDFKGISYLKFKPKKINLLIGKNNTCKSTILEAISLSLNPENIHKQYIDNLSDLIRAGADNSQITINNDKIKIEKPDSIELLKSFKDDFFQKLKFSLTRVIKKDFFEKDFINEIDKEFIKVLTPSIKEELIKRSVKLTKNNKLDKVFYNILDSEILERLNPFLEKVYLIVKKRYKLRSPEDYRYLLHFFIDRAYRSELVDINDKDVIFIRNIRDQIKNFMYRERNQETTKKIHEIEKFIKKYNLIENLERLDYPYVIFKGKTEGDLNSIPFNFLGDGFKAMVGFLWTLSFRDINHKIVLLDEPEIHMHPAYIRELVKILLRFSKEFEIQFFIVTHNCDLIDTFFDEEFIAEDQEYLRKDLITLHMEELEGYTQANYLTYADAKKSKDDLLLDLRGI